MLLAGGGEIVGSLKVALLLSARRLAAHTRTNRRALDTQQVADELACDSCVMPLAVNYVDRFLASTAVTKDQLQLLGAVALLVASKLRQCNSIHPEALVFYSDYSMTISDITVRVLEC